MQTTELALLLDRFMRKIHFGLQSKAASFDTEKVGPGGGIILLTLADMGCTSLHELTRRVSRDKSQMTRSIRSLEAKGLVKRETSPEDARVSLVSLTKDGERVVGELQDAVADTIGDLLAPLPDAEAARLKRLLAQVVSDNPASD